jgi:hypothetical protein
MAERPAVGGALRDDDQDGLPKRNAKARRRRSTEPVPEWATCRWLNRCAGADLVHDEWLALEMWAPPLHAALIVPKFGRKYPCHGCPIYATKAS